MTTVMTKTLFQNLAIATILAIYLPKIEIRQSLYINLISVLMLKHCAETIFGLKNIKINGIVAMMKRALLVNTHFIFFKSEKSELFDVKMLKLDFVLVG